MTKKLVFLTGTRADYGKIKTLMDKVECSDVFECHIFVTGMHMLSKYGLTVNEIEKARYHNIYKFINQADTTKMDIILSNTILGFSHYVNEIKPDMIVVHGDRIEPLAGAIVGALNNIRVAHIEGGELSGTVDELLRHSISKLAHLHFVSNQEAANRLMQMGEKKESIFVIGSPDLDVMRSDHLPSLKKAKKRYGITFDEYAIFSYHPVTTELDMLEKHIHEVISALLRSEKNYIVIYPNNDEGTNVILQSFERLKGNDRFNIYPSLRFEYFLLLLKHADFIIGNSSAGIREAEYYGIPTIDIGSRQNNRHKSETVVRVPESEEQIIKAIHTASKVSFEPISHFGEGNSSELFYKIICDKTTWEIDCQKQFVDVGLFDTGKQSKVLS